MPFISSVSVSPSPPSNPDYSPPYPWYETGVVLFLVLLFGGVFVRWLPGYLTRRENDARAARDAAWLAELKRDEDDRLIRDTLLSRHLNQSQTVFEDLLATQKAISGMEVTQATQLALMRGAYARILKQQSLQSKLLELTLAQVKGLRADIVGDALSERGSQSGVRTRPQGVGQSPYQPIKLENSGIDC
jgi:hypothetical protein